MSNSQPPLSAGERFSIAVGAFFRALLRLIIVILAGVILAGLLYMGFVLIYQQAILPARENAARLSLLETQQAAQMDQLSQRMEKLQQQVTELGNEMIVLQDEFAALKRDQEMVQSTQQAYPLQLKRLDELEKKLAQVQKIGQDALQLAEENQKTIASGELLAGLEYQLTVLKSALLIQRARVYLGQANLGLARDEIRAARILLIELQQTASEEQKAELAAWLGRLDSALVNLPDRPVMAASDLQTAENLILLPPMLEETPIAPLAVEETQQITSTGVLISTPTPAGTLALTPTGTLTASPTPSPTP
jgi:cell division protein FtsB